MSELQEFLSEVELGSVNVLSVAKKALPNGDGSLVVNLENKRVMPLRMESPARAHTFHDAKGFVRYLSAVNAAHPDKKSMLVLADVEKEDWQVVCILDEKAPHGFEVITLQPAKHPVFCMLEETLLDKGKRLVTDLATAVMRNRHVICDSPQCTARNLAMMMQQITVSTKTTACTGVGKKATNGVMVETEVKAGLPQAELIELPDTISVKVPIYLNTEPVVFGIDLTIGVEQGVPVALIDCPELLVRQFEVFEDMLEPIKAMEGVFVSYGTIRTAGWVYNNK